MTDQDGDQRLVALSALVQFEQQVRQAEDARALAYIAVNDVRRVVDFRQAFLWRIDEFGRVRIESISNISEIDPNAPAVQRIQRLASWVREHVDLSDIQPFSFAESQDEQVTTASESLAQYPVSVPLKTANGEVRSGLVFTADTPWTEAGIMLLSLIADAFAHDWYRQEGTGKFSAIRAHFARTWKRYLIAIVVFFLIPVRQYVLAPAEVVPREPRIIAAPMEGVIDQIKVEPNDHVESDTPLFVMEDTDLRNEYILSEKALEVARAEYLRNSQQAFDCEDCRGRVPQLRAAMEREKAAMEWAKEQLEMSVVKAPADGTVVFSDPSEWEGKPVKTGEKVMTLSDPKRTRLKVELPVEDAISLEKGSEVVFYPNVDPLDDYAAELQSISYEARESGKKTLSFPVYASFNGDELPRLGLHGTAKLYGDRVPLIYLVLRKPLSWLRRTLGI